MLKILHVYKTYRTETAGGIEEVIRQISYGCFLFGIKSKVLTFSKNPNPQKIFDGEVEVVRYPINFSFASTDFSLSGFFAFRKLTGDADIIHYHFPCPTSDLMQFFFRPQKPFIITYHSDIVKQKKLLRIYTPLMHWFLRRSSAILASSPNYIKTSKILIRYPEKTSVITYGLNEAMEAKPSAETIERIKKSIGYEKFFLFVGVLRYYKGLHYLLEANAGIDYPLVIAGSGPKEAELKAQAKSLGLKNVIFLGRISDEEKVALLDLSYGFVFPSHLRSEAFGISLLEAAMHAKPLISTEIGTGTSYININNETGFTVPPENPEALQNAMQFLWDNPEKAAEMGKSARNRYKQVFTADKMAEEYAKLYKSLCKHSN